MIRYGLSFPSDLSALDIELYCYKHDERAPAPGGRLDPFDHFKNIVEMTVNRPESPCNFLWNEWSEKMVRLCIEEKYAGIAGCGSSSKSASVGLWAIVEYMAAPSATSILITSTTLRDARKRVWKSITEYWNAIEPLGIPGKLVDSKGQIVGVDKSGKFNDGMGITIIPAGAEYEKHAVKKLVGQKAYYFRIIADELNELGEAVLTAGFGNSNTNPDFKLIAMGNPALLLDPLGKFCEPIGGWDSVTEDDYEWRTKRGKVMRFDATKSPRLTDADGEKYFFMPSQESIDVAAEHFGINSRRFFQMFRGMWLKQQEENTIFSESEFMAHETPDEPVWDNEDDVKVVVAADISFTQGGDRSIVAVGKCGKIKGKKVMWVERVESISENTGENVSLDILNSFRAIAMEAGARPAHCGYDSTGAGMAWGHWLQHEWSTDVKGINFAEAPIERKHALEGGHEAYGNRVAQLWVQLKPLLRAASLLNVPREAISEFVTRRYDAARIGHKKIWVERKVEMKKRTGMSPDISDAIVILCEVAILNNLLDFEEVKGIEAKAFNSFSQSPFFSRRPQMRRMKY